MHQTATERPAITDLDVAYVHCDFGQERTTAAEKIRTFDIVVRRHRADRDVVVLLADVAEISDPADVDDGLGLREPEFHGGNEAVSACKDFRVFALAKQSYGFIEASRPMIIKI